MRYSFEYPRRGRAGRHVLWRCRHELEMFRSLMVLGVANIHSDWDAHPLATDACESGYGVMEGEAIPDLVPLAGRSDERWRFKRRDGSEVLPRVRGEVLGERSWRAASRRCPRTCCGRRGGTRSSRRDSTARRPCT